MLMSAYKGEVVSEINSFSDYASRCLLETIKIALKFLRILHLRHTCAIMKVQENTQNQEKTLHLQEGTCTNLRIPPVRPG